MKRAITFALLMVVWVSLCPAGWEMFYGGSDKEVGYCVRQASDGGYIIAGYTETFGAGEPDFYLIRTLPTGDTLWTRAFGGVEYDYAYSVCEAADSAFVVCGYTNSFDNFNDIYIVKTKYDGDTLWTRTIGGSFHDYAYSIYETSDSGYIICGSTQSFGHGASDIYLVKTKSNGDTVWTKTFGGSQNEYGYSAVQTADGGYIVCGYTMSFGAGEFDIYLIKTSATGDTLWTKTYGGSGQDFGQSVTQATDGGYIICGSTNSFGAGEYDIYLVKISSDGDLLWTQTFGGTGEEFGRSLYATPDGGCILCGSTMSFGAGDEDVYIIKTDSTGEASWTNTYGGTRKDGVYSVVQTSDGGYIMSGTTTSFGAGSYDVYLLKTDSLGSVEGVWEDVDRPEYVSLKAYPTPFNSAITLELCGVGATYRSPEQIAVEIFDISGRLVYAPSPTVPLPKGEGGETLLPPGEGGSKSRMRHLSGSPTNRSPQAYIWFGQQLAIDRLRRE